ncbi:MAG: hypothetical protein CL534_15750 [Ahrensia sp.]|nr:hypothetical protein [Ahrensia sp.]
MQDLTTPADKIEAIGRDLARPRSRIALSPEMEAEFDNKTCAGRFSAKIRWQFIAVLTNLACLPLDHFAGVFKLGLQTRLGVVVPLYVAAILVLLRGPARLHSAAMTVPLFGFASAVIFIGFHAPPADGAKYLMSTALLLIFSNLVVPMSFRQALAATLGSIASLFVLLATVGAVTPGTLGMCGFVASASLISLFVRFRSERDLRNTFLLSRQDEIKSQHLVALSSALAELAETDPLTELPNRRHLSQQLEAKWRLAAESNDWLAILMIDIDHFKSFNDTAGHDEGDRCLKAIAAAMHEEAGRNGHYVARFGGEEFTAILTGLEPEPAMQVAENLREAIERLDLKHPAFDPGRCVTVSIGASASLPSRQTTVKELMAAADRALYDAKAAGRNRVAFGSLITTDGRTRPGQKAG